MKRVPFFLLALIIATGMTVTPDASAEGFSLYGVKMGMSKADVAEVWTPLESGTYVIKDAPFFDLNVEFDIKGRLFRLSFQVPLDKNFPSNLNITALQRVIQQLWGDDRSVAISTQTSRGAMVVTVTSTALQDELINDIMKQITIMFHP